MTESESESEQCIRSLDRGTTLRPRPAGPLPMMACSICGAELIEVGERERSLVALPGGGQGWSYSVAMQCPNWPEHVRAWQEERPTQ